MIHRHNFSPPNNTRLANLCGPTDEHLRRIEEALEVKIAHRHEQFKVDGPKARAERTIELLQAMYEIAGRPIEPATVQLMLTGDGKYSDDGNPTLVTRRTELRPRTPGQAAYLDNIASHDITLGIGPAGTGKTYLAVACAVDALERSAVQRIVLTRPAVEAGERLGFLPGDLTQDLGDGGPSLVTRRNDLRPRTPVQARYLDNIAAHDITLGIGPAGTGKTYLAVACAVDALERSAVQRIVLTRPAVEAGERLGFLPGDLTQKVDPYLRPLYDALYDLMGYDKVQKAFERNALEVAPLAFMRGRTLNNAFVILDEAQNTTPEQMKMFLTRLGFGAKAVITGDVSQIDLPKDQLSGLIDAERVLKRVTGIAITRFTTADVVRHPLVARIVDAYDSARQADSA